MVRIGGGPDWLSGPSIPGVLHFLLLGSGVLGVALVLAAAWALVRPRTRFAEPYEVGRPRNWYRLLGNLLLLAGGLSLVFAAFVYFTDFFTGDRVLPQPVALAGATAGSDSVLATPPAAQLAAAMAVTPSETAIPSATSTPAPTPTPTPVPAEPGTPVRIVIPSIGVDSKVKEIGTVWVNGELQWDTVPWYVGHYKTTAQAGEKGNAVFSGHVTSRAAGNVFADLYKVQLGDEVQVYTDDHEFTYVVSSIVLVKPTEIGVMAPTPDPQVTLITCAGEWIPEEHQYTLRLIVSARLESWQ